MPLTNTEKARRYRARHAEEYRQWNREYYRLHKANKLRAKRFAGKKCKLCGITLSGVAGAYGTKVHCLDCSEQKTLIQRLNMRRWRERLKLTSTNEGTPPRSIH